MQSIQRLLESDCGVAARGDHLGLQSVRGDELGEVLDEVEADHLDSPWGAGNLPFGGIPLLDRRSFGVRSIRKDAVEYLVDRLPEDVQLGESTLVEDGDRSAVLDRLLDGVGVDVRAERLEGASVLPVDRRAGETEEAGVRERLAHVRSEAPVLRAVRFIHHDEDVLCFGKRRMDGIPGLSPVGAREFLELLDGGHHGLADRVLQDLSEVSHAVRAFWVRESTCGEHACDLPVELCAVGDDDDGRLLLRGDRVGA